MTTGERKLWLIFGIGCLLIAGILLIGLWHYLQLIAFLVVGLGVLAVLVILTLHVLRTVTELAVKLHEQKLRQERLRPNDNGHYEIPLDESRVPIILPSTTQRQEGQIPYSRGYTSAESYSRRWED